MNIPRAPIYIFSKIYESLNEQVYRIQHIYIYTHNDIQWHVTLLKNTPLTSMIQFKVFESKLCKFLIDCR